MVCPIIFSHHQHTGCILVESVHNPRPQRTSDTFELRTVIKKSIHQCAAVMPRRRVDHQPGLFINNDNIIVFMQDLDGNWLWFEWDRRWGWYTATDLIPGLYSIPRLFDHTLNPNCPISDQVGRNRTGTIRNASGDV